MNNSTNNKDCEKQEGEKEIYIQEKKKEESVCSFQGRLKKQIESVLHGK